MKNKKTTLIDHLRDSNIKTTNSEELIKLNQDHNLGYSELYLKSFLRNSTGDNNSGYKICTTNIGNNMYQIHHN